MNSRIRQEVDALRDRLKRNPSEEAIRAEFELLSDLSLEIITSEDRSLISRAHRELDDALYGMALDEHHRMACPSTLLNLQVPAQTSNRAEASTQSQTPVLGIAQQPPQEDFNEKTSEEFDARAYKEEGARIKAAIATGATLNQTLVSSTPEFQAAALSYINDQCEGNPSLYAAYLSIELKCKEEEIEKLHSKLEEQAQQSREVVSAWEQLEEEGEMIATTRKIEINELNRKLEEFEGNVKKLTKENEELKRLHISSIIDAKRANSDYAQVHNSLMFARSEAMAKIDQLKSAEIQIKSLNAKVDKLEKKRSLLRTRNETLLMDNDKLNTENDELKAAQENGEAIIQDIMTTQEELRCDLQMAEKRVEYLTNQIQTANDNAKKRNDEIRRLNEENMDLLKVQEDVREERTIFSERLKQSDERVETLNRDLECLEDFYSNIKKENKELKKSSEELKSTHEALKENHLELQEKFELAEYRIDVLLEEIESESEKFQEDCIQNEDLKVENQELKSSLEALEAARLEDQAEIEKLKSMNYWSEDFIEYLKAESKSMSEKYKKDKETLEASNEQLRSAQAALESAQVDAQSEIQNLTSKFELADDRIAYLEDRLTSEKEIYEKTCIEKEELESLNEELKRRNESVESNMKQLQSDYCQTRTALRTSQNKSESEIQKLTEKLRNANILNKQLEEKIDFELKEKKKLKKEMEIEMATASLNNTIHSDTVSSLRDQLNKYTSALNCVKTRLVDAQDALETSKLSNQKLSENLEKSEAEKKESDKSLAIYRKIFLEDVKARDLKIVKVCHEALLLRQKWNSLNDDFKKSKEIAKEEMKQLMEKYGKQGKLLEELQLEKEEKKAERMELENDGYDLSTF